MKRRYIWLFSGLAAGVICITVAVLYALICAYLYVAPNLPTVEAMRNTEFQVPLRVYARSGQLIAQIGEQRRIPVSAAEIPDLVRKAFIAAEDDRFFKHSGIDYLGVLRAALVNLVSGSKTQGASTITMQTARNMFLTLDRTYSRKLQEVFLTYRMEHEFTKDEILSLYLNVIFFGQRSYGVAAAADAYFGKPLDKLSVAEVATLAGLPQAPSRFNPITNPEGAGARRAYVLRRMRELGYIDAETAEAASAEPVKVRAGARSFDVEAPYVAELARLELVRRFGAAAQNEGYKVVTTIDSRLQAAANRAVRLGLLEYDRRHGWRGPVSQVSIEASATPAGFEELLAEFPQVGMLRPALVTAVAGQTAKLFVKDLGRRSLEWEAISWARPAVGEVGVGPEPRSAADVLGVGDVVYVVASDNARVGAELVQVPEAEAALVSLDPRDGAVAAMVGGFDYFDKAQGKFNRATQAERQPGSSFKPFLYSAALEDGFTPASIIMDAPVVMEGDNLEEDWRPVNSGGQFYGPTRLREALVRSRNLVSIRILRDLGIPAAIDHATQFGFVRSTLPNNLTLALGTVQITPINLAARFATFANGGYRVDPYYIDRIIAPDGKTVWQAEPRMVCPDCEFLPEKQRAERAISAANAWLMDDMMRDVVRRGTGRRAMALGRNDVAGKTGTTNEAKDTWFNGFTPDVVTSVWVGYDQARPLGAGEEGSRTALPIWIEYMREALRNLPQHWPDMPGGLVRLRISPSTGAPASEDDPDAIVETFLEGHLPNGEQPVEGMPQSTVGSGNDGGSGEPIF
ncbi:MAG: penicillin-binding protein 1A [Steroidobacteraceae bacterium]